MYAQFYIKRVLFDISAALCQTENPALPSFAEPSGKLSEEEKPADWAAHDLELHLGFSDFFKCIFCCREKSHGGWFFWVGCGVVAWFLLGIFDIFGLGLYDVIFSLCFKCHVSFWHLPTTAAWSFQNLFLLFGLSAVSHYEAVPWDRTSSRRFFIVCRGTPAELTWEFSTF